MIWLVKPCSPRQAARQQAPPVTSRISFHCLTTPPAPTTPASTWPRLRLLRRRGPGHRDRPAARDSADALIGAGGAQMGVSYPGRYGQQLLVRPAPLHGRCAIINTTPPRHHEPCGRRHHASQAHGGPPTPRRTSPSGRPPSRTWSGRRQRLSRSAWCPTTWTTGSQALQGQHVRHRVGLRGLGGPERQGPELRREPSSRFISIDDVFDYYTPVIAANDDFAKENPDQVKAFLRAVKKGYEFCVENPSDAADILCDACRSSSDLVHASQDYLKDQYIADLARPGASSTAAAGPSSHRVAERPGPGPEPARREQGLRPRTWRRSVGRRRYSCREARASGADAGAGDVPAPSLPLAHALVGRADHDGR